MRHHRLITQAFFGKCAAVIGYTAFVATGSLAYGTDIVMAGTKDQMTQAYALYKKGDYPGATQLLSKIKTTSRDDQAIIAYWSGLCHSRLQAFDKATISFKRALQLGSKAEDLEYELGQALYASQQLKPAREAFKKSLEAKYKPGASAYYIGFISQLLEEYPAALASYQAIQKQTEDPEKVKQAALFQSAEVRLAQVESTKDEKVRKGKVRKEVIPEFEKAVSYDESSHVGQQAKLRLNQIKSMLSADIPRMRNGTPIAAQPHYVKVSVDGKYDTNVITEADRSLSQVSNKSSLILKSGAFAKYEFIFDRQFTLTPEVDFSHTYHLNQTEPNVFQNDAISVLPAARSRWEHTLFGEPSALTFDFEFNYLIRDVAKTHTLSFYSQYYNFVLGERFKLLKIGSTSLNFNIKLYENQDTGLNAFNPGVSLSQNISFGRSFGLKFIFNVDYTRARNATNDKLAYRLTTSTNFPDLFAGFDLSALVDLTVTDTKNQIATRGVETTINPSLTFSRNFGKTIFASLNYSFTRNFSKDETNYAYSKHIVGLGIGYRL